MAYNKLIFVSKENVTLSPMAEWIIKYSDGQAKRNQLTWVGCVVSGTT